MCKGRALCGPCRIPTGGTDAGGDAGVVPAREGGDQVATHGGCPAGLANGRIAGGGVRQRHKGMEEAQRFVGLFLLLTTNNNRPRPDQLLEWALSAREKTCRAKQRAHTDHYLILKYLETAANGRQLVVRRPSPAGARRLTVSGCWSTVSSWQVTAVGG